jgi:hypothetical protein
VGEGSAREEFISQPLIIGPKSSFSLPKFRFPPMPRAEVVPTNELGTFHIPTLTDHREKKTKKPPQKQH